MLRGGGVAAALLLLILGFFTGGFFLLLTGVLAAVALIGGWLLAALVQRESWYERPNARILSLLIAIALPIGLIAFGQVAGPLLTPEPEGSHCFSGSLARGEQLEEALAVDPRIERMWFSFEVAELRGGAIRWWITDPFGQVQSGGRAETAGYSETDEVVPAGGRWLMIAQSEADHAQFSIAWTSEIGAGPDTPAQVCP